MNFSDPTNLCRLCLNEIPSDEQEGINLRQSTAQDFIETLLKCFSLSLVRNPSHSPRNTILIPLSVQLEVAHNWPGRICQPCTSQVNQFSDFHTLIHRNQEVILLQFGSPIQMKEEEEDTKDTPFESDAEEEPTLNDIEEGDELPKPLSVSTIETKNKQKKKKTPPTRRSVREKRQIYDLKQRPPVQRVKSTREKNSTATVEEINEDIRSFIALKCNQCEKKEAEHETTFDTFRELTVHWRSVHGSDGHVSCCGSNFNRRYTLHRHILLHQNPTRFQCDECPKVFADKWGLAQHKAGHMPEEARLFVCPVCGKRFPREGQLRDHELRIHTPVEQRPFACPDCGKRYFNQCEVVGHRQRVHEKLRPFFCDKCARAFATRGGLQVHQRVHEDHPRVACDECGRFYSGATQVKNHKKRAHQQGQGQGQEFECAECGQRLKHATGLTAHIRRMHKLASNQHQCDLCGKGYKEQMNLREHMASAHTGQRLYKCKFCELSCNSSANMYKHQKTKHPVEYAAMKEAREKKWFTEERG